VFAYLRSVGAPVARYYNHSADAREVAAADLAAATAK